MATSVLGKRSRRAIEREEVASPLPPRKRVTRRSIPQIYEDAGVVVSQDLEQQIVVPAKHAAGRAQRAKKPLPKQRQLYKSCSTTLKDVDVQDALRTDSEHDENCPPVDFSVSTPSTTRFKNVVDTTPITPKHRVRALGGLLTPRTPRSIDVLKPRAQNVYAQARQLFTQCAAPTKLVGRDTERQQLREFITDCKEAGCGGCKYISGPPGTGKSAVVQEVLKEFEDDAVVQISIVNCVSLRTATQVYGKMLEDLAPNSISGKTPAETQLRRLFMSKSTKATYVVMLDEVDSLIDFDCEILYTIFEWALQPSSSLTLIGIANALDLTDRFLPRLKSKGLKPQLLPFLPYTSQQISDIITEKLRSLLPKHAAVASDFVPCIHPAAVQLCSKKIASQTGDLRKAFNLVRRSIDQVEKEALSKLAQESPSKQPLEEVTNQSTLAAASLSPTPSTSLSFTAESAPRATIAHVAKLASSIFNNGTLSRLSGLNLQQKAVLCSIVSKESRRQERNPFITPTKTANKAPTMGELYLKYTWLCKRDEGLLQPLKDTEFRDVVASLETLGLVHESKARTSSLLTPSSSSRMGRNADDRQIASTVAEKEMRESLSGPGADLLRRLLDEF